MTLNVKIVDKNNWLQPDPISAILVKVNIEEVSADYMSGEDWVSAFSNVDLSNKVPETVSELFEVARGSLAYGYFFYPLCTLAFEQLFRVAEAAATQKCQMINAPKSKTKTFQDKIQCLTDEGFISNQNVILWDSFRNLRNLASHPTQQNKFSLGMIIPILKNVRDEINTLFSK